MDFVQSAPKLIGKENLHRIDVEFIMCHFELAARESRIKGRWIGERFEMGGDNKQYQYILSWVE